MIFLYVLLGLVAVLLLIQLSDSIYRYYILKAFYVSFIWVKESISFLVSISGPIRKGKTTLMYALSHLIQLKMFNDLNEKMLEIETILIDISFNELRTKYNEYIESGLDHVVAMDKILSNYFVDFNGRTTLIKNLDNVYFNHLKFEENISLLKRYLYYYSHSIRSNFVFSNVRAWSQITSSYSLDLKSDWLKLKNNWMTAQNRKTKDFPLEEYSVFLFDEQLIENSNTNATSRLYEDSGSDIFYRLFGQIFRESSYYLTTLQNVERWFKSEREIVQQHIYVRERKLILTSPIKMKFVELFERFNSWMYGLYKNEEFINSNNRFKRRRLKCLDYRTKAIANGFIRFECSIYDNVDSVGKWIKPEDQTAAAYNFNFMMPVCYSWDIGNTHLFHCLYEYLKEHSEKSIFELASSEITLDDIENMLKKYKEKSSSSIEF